MLNKIKRLIFKSRFKKSYAQSGEDMILHTIFANVKKGTYVDVGACDPYFQSNTQFFYGRGWSGINIDANENSINKLNKKRKRDKNILALIHNIEKELEFYFYENPAYNGCIYQENIPSRLMYIKKLKSTTLNALLANENLKKINFLSIDVEGNDRNVLSSLDLKNIRPQVIVVESFTTEIVNELNSDITGFLASYGYKFLCKTVTNSFYISKEFAEERFNK